MILGDQGDLAGKQGLDIVITKNLMQALSRINSTFLLFT